MINWQVIATIAAPIIALFIGIWANRRYESRPVLIAYFSHVSSFKVSPSGAQPSLVNTHSVVLRNIGRKTATNVRLHHIYLPDFNIWPDVAHSVETLPNQTKDILIPALVPGEEITISYLYFPPLTVAQVNAGIKSDQGFARHIAVLLQRRVPRWMHFIVAALMITGLVSILYVLYNFVTKALLDA